MDNSFMLACVICFVVPFLFFRWLANQEAYVIFGLLIGAVLYEAYTEGAFCDPINGSAVLIAAVAAGLVCAAVSNLMSWIGGGKK